MFSVVQKTARNSPWRVIRKFHTLDEAVICAKSLDQDGLITPDIRIINPMGERVKVAGEIAQ